MRNACLYTPWKMDLSEEGYRSCLGGEAEPTGGGSGRGRNFADISEAGVGIAGGTAEDAAQGSADLGLDPGGIGDGGRGGFNEPNVNRGGGVTINVNPQLLSPVTETPTERPNVDTTRGQGATRGAARRRRSGTLLTLGLAETTRKTLLGQ